MEHSQQELDAGTTVPVAPLVPVSQGEASAAPALDAMDGATTASMSTAASHEADDTAILKARIRALESVIELERRLRRKQEASRNNALTANQPEPRPETAASDVATASELIDDDATVLAAPSRRISSQLPAGESRASADTPPVADEVRMGTADAVLALPTGFRLHEYRIDSVLGQGGFGITYLATDVHLNVKVAIKEYLPGSLVYRASDRSVTPRWSDDREFYQHGLDSFLVEARTLATFRHPNIVRVARFFEAHRTAYIVLEYERGEALKTWWPAHSSLPEPDLLALLRPLIDGLAVVHQAGYLHRDIKPDNIFARRDDGSLVLLDFGAARQTANPQHDPTNAVTPGYAAIEQYDGRDQGPWTDIYAIGATLYWMLTGHKPASAIERLDQVLPMLSAEQAGQGRYSAEFLRAVDWALCVDPKDRPQNLHEFQRALFAGHVFSLGLQEALRAGDAETVVSESWRALLDSPRLLKAHLARLWRGAMRPGSWPLAAKMTIAMVLAALLPMTITAYYNLDRTLASVSDSELRNLEQVAQSSAGRVSQLIGDSRNLANYLGTDEDFVEFLGNPTAAGAAAIQAKLESLAKANPDIHPLMVMDREGTALVSNDAGVTGKNFKFREYFKQAMAGRSHMTGMVVGSTAGAAGIYYSNPVRDAAGNIIGAVVLRIKSSAVEDILRETRRSGLTPLLVDGDGVLIYHPDPKRLYQSLVPLSDTKLKEIVADQRFRRSKIESLNMPDLAAAMVRAPKAGNVSYASTISRQSEIAGFAPVKGHNWVVAVSETRESFEAPLNRLFRNVLSSVAVVGMVFLGLAILFARSIVRPVERLTAAAHALKEGDYAKATIPVTSDDEIGRLARTFNVMIDVLRQRDREYNGKQRQAAPKDDSLGPPDATG